ncbi:PTS sugar transporter subunit IIA [Erysipelothrix inopinata]|uniref:PTS sugar transporter subunit IIA n=1 Tax=Erysipelothrix inopinata TaxID=225084 RepID=A0A7G9RX14_9FIRM|nr:PTS sugar transporter subunit IIA [Erysipelothrix inopinata]QNN60139.1 PTS sugar transporter subunit IIA [Erysipelothrix inopinata]
MSVSKRQIRILEILSNQDSFMTVNELADEIKVSVRTVYYDLDQIQLMMPDQFELIRRPGLGVRGQWKKTMTEKLTTQEFDDEYVYMQIFKQLVIDSKTITILNLSSEYYVSTTSIVEHLSQIESKVSSSSQLQLISDHLGTRVQGSEYQRQQLMIDFNNHILEQLGPNTTLDHFAEMLKRFYDTDIVEAASNFQEDIKELNLRIVAPYYQFNIFSVLIVMMQRIRNNYHIESIEHNSSGKNIYALNHYVIAQTLFEKMKSTVIFEETESDIYTLAVYLQGYRLEFETIQHEFVHSYQDIARDLIKKMSLAINEDLTQDDLLLNNLSVHLYHMDYRMKHNIIIRNPLLSEIIKDFRLMYDLVWLMMDTENEINMLTVTEDEVGFLLLHFQTALDRRQSSRMIYVVSQNSYVSQDFILSRIRTVVSSLDVIKIVDPEAILNVDTNQIDLIISTIPLETMATPYALVSPLITSNDLLIIAQKYQNMLTTTTFKENNTFNHYTNPKFIYFMKDASSKEEILNEMLSDLIEFDYIDERYAISVWTREKEGGTFVGNATAVPHGSIKYVKETIIPIWINKTPVKWGDNKVQIVFLYAISNDDLKNSKTIIKSILNFLKDNKNLPKEVQSMDFNTFKHLVYGG